MRVSVDVYDGIPEAKTKMQRRRNTLVCVAKEMKQAYTISVCVL